MRDEELFKIMAGIDDEYISEAENFQVQRAHNTFARYIGIVASFLIVAGIIGLVLFLNRNKDMPIITDPSNMETIIETSKTPTEAGINETVSTTITPTGVNDTPYKQFERIEGSPEGKDIMGLGEYRIDTLVLHASATKILLFVTCEDDRVFAECGRNIAPYGEPEAYSFVDMDGDGISELICNYQYGTGAERVIIYRNNNGTIECSGINEVYICKQLGLDMLGSATSYREIYDYQSQMIKIILSGDQYANGGVDIILEIGLDETEAFEFHEYEYLE